MKCSRRGIAWALGVGATGAVAACSASSSEPSRLDGGSSGDSGPIEPAGDADAGQDGGAVGMTFPKVRCAGSACVQELAAAMATFCARTDDGKVYCWGDPSTGLLGTLDAGVRGAAPGDAGEEPVWYATPRPVPFAQAVKRIALGGRGQGAAGCAILADGTGACWGANTSGQLGGPDSMVDEKPHPEPRAIASAVHFDQLAISDYVGCATTSEGEPHCWGENSNEVLRNDAGTHRKVGSARAFISSPGPYALPKEPTAVGAMQVGLNYILFADRLSGVAYSAGSNQSALGRSAFESTDVILERVLDLPHGVTELTTTTGASCAVTAEADAGELYCWGANYNGALGTGSTDAIIYPKRVVVPRVGVLPQRVSLGYSHMCMVSSDGDVWCAGSNAFGQIGPAEDATLYFLTRVEGLPARAVDVVVSDDTVCALLESGTVACWGGNRSGELGRDVADEQRHPKPEVVELPPSGGGQSL